MSASGRLLIVDDEDDIRLIARISLERIGGWEVLDARSAEEAVAAAHSGPLDVVLLDVMMPGVDGPGTLELLRPVIGSDTPVIFLTAKTQAADRERLAGLGAAGLIAKPFDPMTLPAEVSARLSQP
ncbi:MAG: response regulator [Solirubrobacterales bacterium]|nr:response regulator [Solirubrobacterales bacterium]MBV9716838.1 response regulator [Solirubrobacterales bacterium]